MSDQIDFDHGIPVSSFYDADGFLGVSTDLYGEEDAGAPAAEVQMPYGIFSRPLDPTLDANGDPVPTTSGQAVFHFKGSEQHVTPGQDPRVVPNLPQLSKGSSVQYGAGPNTSFQPSFHVIDADTGDQTIYVPYAFSGGVATKAHVISISASGDNVTVRHSGGAGASFTSDAAVMNGPDGSAFLQLGNAGVMVLNGNLTVTGTIGQGPAPSIPALDATFTPNPNFLLSPPG